MSKKVKPSKRLSKPIQQLTNGRAEAEDLLAELENLGAQKILQEGLEAEIYEFLWRGWHENNGPEDSKGYRNRYRPKTFKTQSGPATAAISARRT